MLGQTRCRTWHVTALVADSVCVRACVRVCVCRHVTQVAKLLVEKGADVSARDTMEGQTALHICAGSGSVDVLDVLLTTSPNVNITRTSDGFVSATRGAIV
jgi:hypothetical protein